MKKNKDRFFNVLLVFISVSGFSATLVLGDLDVALLVPGNNMVLNTSNVTLNCSINGSNPISYVEVYHDVDAAFSKDGDEYLKGKSREAGNVLLFHFNNDSFVIENDSFVHDWSGGNNNGNATGAIYNLSGGKWFGAFEFSGSANDYILVEDSSSLDLTNNGTIEFWFKLNNKNSLTFLSKGWEADDNYNSFTINFNIDATQWLKGTFGSGSDSQLFFISYDTINTGQWYHVAVTWNGTKIVTYLNGAKKLTITQNIIPYNSVYDLKIGTGVYGNLNGAIDDLLIFNRTLSEVEISDHYNQNFTAKTNTSVSFNLTNVSDGSYIWNCLAYDNESSNW